MQDRFIKKLWHTNRKCFIEEFSILQTINSEGNFEHTYFEKSPKGELSRLSTCQIKEVLCTGLKDKNGNIIYEGDIVKIGNGSINGSVMETVQVVRWDQKGTKFTAPTFQNDENGNYVEGNFSHYYEIIGNIYENPELLEAKGEEG